MTAALPPRVLRLDPSDNVAVVLEALSPGEVAEVDGSVVTVREPIGFGHKVALAAIPAGSPVRKYGEVIGIATSDIEPGAHAHVHNVVSARLPGANVSKAAR